MKNSPSMDVEKKQLLWIFPLNMRLNTTTTKTENVLKFKSWPIGADIKRNGYKNISWKTFSQASDGKKRNCSVFRVDLIGCSSIRWLDDQLIYFECAWNPKTKGARVNILNENRMKKKKQLNNNFLNKYI